MTLPTGTITMNQVNVELGNPGTSNISLNDSDVRTLAGKPSGTISMNDLRGKSNADMSGGDDDWSSGGYNYRVWTSTGTVSVSGGPAMTIQALVIAGGAPAQAQGSAGGGGGAGGMRWITVPGPTASSGAVVVGGALSDSSIWGYSARRGGIGGVNSPPGIPSMPGGSGAGAGHVASGGTGNSPPVSPPQGRPGGSFSAPGTSQRGGGGGGYGASGGPGNASSSGNGGNGGPSNNPAIPGPDWSIPISYGTTGPSPGRWFAGGGGGYNNGSGGAGGGGDGYGPTSPFPSTRGKANTGGGAGGGSAGGSGIIIVRWTS